jgi:hypothetical protein
MLLLQFFLAPLEDHSDRHFNAEVVVTNLFRQIGKLPPDQATPLFYCRLDECRIIPKDRNLKAYGIIFDEDFQRVSFARVWAAAKQGGVSGERNVIPDDGFLIRLSGLDCESWWKLLRRNLFFVTRCNRFVEIQFQWIERENRCQMRDIILLIDIQDVVDVFSSDAQPELMVAMRLDRIELLFKEYIECRHEKRRIIALQGSASVGKFTIRELAVRGALIPTPHLFPSPLRSS